jgi:glycosyltransferase involved in cell wall biosynthesis
LRYGPDAPSGSLCHDGFSSDGGTCRRFGLSAEDGRQTAVPVAFVSSHATRAGSERYLSLLLEQIDPAYVRSVICLKAGPFADELEGLGYPLEVIDTGARAPAIISSAWRLRRSLRRSGSAVVHANGVKAALVSTAATIGTDIAVVWFKHDVSRDGWQARLIASRCARVVAASKAVTTTFRDGLRDKVEVLHYQMPDPPVDAAEGRRLVLAEFEPPEPAAVVTLVGRLDPFKGQAELLAIAPELIEQVPGLRFLFVGGEDPAHPDRPAALRREVTARGLEEVVRFTGHRHDALALIAGSDLLAIPSVTNESGMGKEAFPYVGLEALALGTPVIGYDHGGLPEQVGECGVLVPPGDRSALRDVILRLVGDAPERERLARCGRERFLALFALHDLVETVAQRYRTAAGDRR